jgi:hypothetical protein
MVKDTNDFFSLSPFVSGLKKAGETSNSGVVLLDILLNAISQLRANEVSLQDWGAAVSKVDYAAAGLQANSLESRTARVANLTLRMAAVCQKLGQLAVLQTFIRDFRARHNGHLQNNQVALYQTGFVDSFERFLDNGSCE